MHIGNAELRPQWRRASPQHRVQPAVQPRRLHQTVHPWAVFGRVLSARGDSAPFTTIRGDSEPSCLMPVHVCRMDTVIRATPSPTQCTLARCVHARLMPERETDLQPVRDDSGTMRHGLQLQSSLWIIPTESLWRIPVENPYCSCKLTPTCSQSGSSAPVGSSSINGSCGMGTRPTTRGSSRPAC